MLNFQTRIQRLFDNPAHITVNAVIACDCYLHTTQYEFLCMTRTDAGTSKATVPLPVPHLSPVSYTHLTLPTTILV